jgi:hypothetical protein
LQVGERGKTRARRIETVEETPKGETRSVIGFLVVVSALLLVGHTIMMEMQKRHVVVTGVVRDAVSGKPIPGARVSDDEGTWESHRGAWTDSSGRYRYTTRREEQHLTAQAQGYQPQRLILAADVLDPATEATVDFDLQPENLESKPKPLTGKE